MGNDLVSVERLIPAPPAAIFQYLADASRHREIDGSGSVRSAKGDPAPLELGSRFGMSMKMGLPYSMVNTVIEYEQDRLIAWQTVGPSIIGKVVGGRIWRYELEPVEGGTLVRETWDISKESPLSRFPIRRMASMTERNMEKTLIQIERLVSG